MHPNFCCARPDAAEPDAGPKRLATLEKAVRTRRSLMRDTLFVLAGVLLVGGGIAGYLYYQATQTGVAAAKKLWDPLLQSSRPVLIVVGTSHPDQMVPENDQTTFGDHMSNPYHHVSVSSAIALARLGGVLHQRGKDYEVKEAIETSLTDIRSRSLILVGAMNNPVDDAAIKAPQDSLHFREFHSPHPGLGESPAAELVHRFHKAVQLHHHRLCHRGALSRPHHGGAGAGNWRDLDLMEPKPQASLCSRRNTSRTLRQNCRVAGRTRTWKWC